MENEDQLSYSIEAKKKKNNNSYNNKGFED